MSTTGERIRLRREELGWTQEELAKRLGYKTRGAISHIENDHTNLSSKKIKEIADVLGVTPDYLLFDKDDFHNSEGYRDRMFEKYRTLFDLVEDATPEELKEVERVVKAILNRDDGSSN
ncbi:MAG: helix-turn-helix domain-containing protein [Lachnospiraceae bacterium]